MLENCHSQIRQKPTGWSILPVEVFRESSLQKNNSVELNPKIKLKFKAYKRFKNSKIIEVQCSVKQQ